MGTNRCECKKTHLKMLAPAIAARTHPVREKCNCWIVPSPPLRSSFAAVCSHEALSNGWLTLSWYAEASARCSPKGAHAPAMMALWCLPAKCLRLMKVSFEERSHTAKLPSASPSTSLPLSLQQAKHVSKCAFRLSTELFIILEENWHTRKRVQKRKKCPEKRVETKKGRTKTKGKSKRCVRACVCVHCMDGWGEWGVVYGKA